MAASTQETSTRIIFQAWELTGGLMEGCTKVCGRETKCMARACSDGATARSMKENSRITSGKASASSPSMTVVCTKDTGSMANSMEKESSSMLMGSSRVELGKKAIFFKSKIAALPPKISSSLKNRTLEALISQCQTALNQGLSWGKIKAQFTRVSRMTSRIYYKA